jgi:ATP-dependent Lon protease
VWTVFGGEVQFVEATAMVGKGDLHLTGQLGDVIKESAQIALTWVHDWSLFDLNFQFQ